LIASLIAPTAAAVPNNSAPQAHEQRQVLVACRERNANIRRGDTLYGVLRAWGLSRHAASRWARRVSRREAPSQLRPGDRIEGCLGRRHERLRLLRINHGRRGLLTLQAEPEGGNVSAFRAGMAVHPAPRRSQWFAITGSLVHDLMRRGVTRNVARTIAVWVDRNPDLPDALPLGTRVSLRFSASGDSPRAWLTQLKIVYDHREHSVFPYADRRGRTLVLGRHGFGYTPIQLRRPVEKARISSGWGWRINPVLHRREFHKGIDYAVPEGTPIHAAAAGTVTIMRWHGNYGRLVQLTHGPGTRTRYGHLSRFAVGLHRGTRVNRGQVIGYVGQTGLSTGPHLYFELYVHDRRVNPLYHQFVVVPIHLAGRSLQAFTRHVKALEARPRYVSGGETAQVINSGAGGTKAGLAGN